MFTFKLVDDAGEGPYRAVVMPEGGGPEVPPILYVNFPEPPDMGSRFTYRGCVWRLALERMAAPGALERADSFWDARPVEQ